MGKHLEYTIICKNHRYLTQARVAIQQCKNSNYNSCIQNCTQVGVQGWYQQNCTWKYQKSKQGLLVLMQPNGCCQCHL